MFHKSFLPDFARAAAPLLMAGLAGCTSANMPSPVTTVSRAEGDGAYLHGYSTIIDLKIGQLRNAGIHINWPEQTSVRGSFLQGASSTRLKPFRDAGMNAANTCLVSAEKILSPREAVYTCTLKLDDLSQQYLAQQPILGLR